MKIAPLLVASATALETSTSASALLSAVGKRNVTHMQALVQSLAEESIKEPGWKFDTDIQEALKAIQNMFVKNIQEALMDQHKADQEGHNCETQSCWDKCNKDYDGGKQRCGEISTQVNGLCEQHKMCRYELKTLYDDYWCKCGELHAFKPPKLECQDEKCICPGLDECIRAVEDASGNMVCKDSGKQCKSDEIHGYGAWLQNMISAYSSAHDSWNTHYGACQEAYKKFLLLDTECDALQAQCEKGGCEVNNDEEVTCNVDKEQCELSCWDTYRKSIPHLQCQEKDRKIDWSATKKIECYLKVLLHNYSEQELIDKCNETDCINVAREHDYHHCEQVCPTPDYEGTWQEPTCDNVGNVAFKGAVGHPFRERASKDSQCEHPLTNPVGSPEFLTGKEFAGHFQEFMGDRQYKCDMNGEEVHTNHRKYYDGKDERQGELGNLASSDYQAGDYHGCKERQQETRCTEHLDIDFQIPPYMPCAPPDGHVCDAEWHCTHYAEFDDTNKLECNDYCLDLMTSQGSAGGCFGTATLTTCSDPEAYENDKIASLNSITFAEDTIAWAYNRCECKRCTTGTPNYPEGPFGGGCTKQCNGPHRACFYELGEPAY